MVLQKLLLKVLGALLVLGNNIIDAEAMQWKPVNVPIVMDHHPTARAIAPDVYSLSACDSNSFARPKTSTHQRCSALTAIAIVTESCPRKRLLNQRRADERTH